MDKFFLLIIIFLAGLTLTYNEIVGLVVPRLDSLFYLSSLSLPIEDEDPFGVFEKVLDIPPSKHISDFKNILEMVCGTCELN